MSTIQFPPKAAGQTGKAPKTDYPRAEPSDKPLGTDEDLTHAWSIGVTQAVRGKGQQCEETCPPEVYIG